MTKRRMRTVIHSWKDIPDFASEAEDAAWWPTVDFGEDFLANSEPVPDDELPPKREESVPAAARKRRAG